MCQALDLGTDKSVLHETEKHPQGLHSRETDRQCPVMVTTKTRKPGDRLEPDGDEVGCECGQGGPF